MHSEIKCNSCKSIAFSLLIRKNGYDLVRCSECDLIFVANPPTEKQRAHLYSFDSGYHVSLDEETESVTFHTNEAKQNLNILRRHAAQGRLLDIGCSTGLFLSKARELGWLGEGLEYSPDSSNIARERYGLKVTTGELRPGLYPSDSFDVVTLWDVIEHVPDPAETLVQIHKILVDSGILVLKTPNADGLYPRLSLTFAHRLGFWGHAEPPGHLYQFSAGTLSRMLERNGYEVVMVHQRRIPISYSFGEPRDWLRSAKWMLYCTLFIPMAYVGPFLSAGDDQIIIARKLKGV